MKNDNKNTMAQKQNKNTEKKVKLPAKKTADKKTRSAAPSTEKKVKKTAAPKAVETIAVPAPVASVPTPKKTAKVTKPATELKAPYSGLLNLFAPLPVGETLLKTYKGSQYEAKVLQDMTVECNGKRYASLTALARAITGSKRINGRAFFGISKHPESHWSDHLTDTKGKYAEYRAKQKAESEARKAAAAAVKKEMKKPTPAAELPVA